MIYDTFNLTMAAATVAVACGRAYVVFKTIQAERRYKRFKAASRAALQGCVPNNIYDTKEKAPSPALALLDCILQCKIAEASTREEGLMKPTNILYMHPELVAIMQSTVRTGSHGYPINVRFSGSRVSLWRRLEAAWLVFSGRADALVWDDGQ